MDLSMRGRSGCESESLPFPFHIQKGSDKTPPPEMRMGGRRERGENEKKDTKY